MEIASLTFFIAPIVTVLCCLFALFAFRLNPTSFFRKPRSVGSGRGGHISFAKTCNCVCSCNASTAKLESEGAGEMHERASVVVERQTGASMMEQLVPEITTHALSYLDYPSLCRLSMTNSLMRKAANDDNAWKALYHKDFTLEQNNVTPINGWKAYYAATRAIVNINAEFFNNIRERSLPGMNRLWLNADYVKCVHTSGELFSGYNDVIHSWQLAFSWEQGDLQIRDVRARVLTEVAWVTLKAYVDMETGPFNVTNVFEFHNGQWYVVHHHSSVNIDGEQQVAHG